MTFGTEFVRGEIVELLPRLRRFARTLARNPHDADDLVQQAVERALAHADQWRSGTPVAHWIFGIMRNAFVDEGRARSRRRRWFVRDVDVSEVRDPAGGGEAELLSIEAAMAQLPDEQRLAVGLVLVEGLSYKEAAAVMDVPIGTLTSRLARGRDTLMQLLDGGGAASS
ncbi:MAG: sigma-70 family RNA polymerase sigma factor [Steroidobacteraceae bacterium]